MTRVRDPTFPGGEAYDASRPALSAVLSLLNCAMFPTGRERAAADGT